MRIRLLLVAIVAVALPATVAAHAEVRSVETQGATRVVVLSAAAESAFLTATNGVTARLDPQDDHILRLTLPPGVATTTVRVLSRDGHVSRTVVGEGRAVGGARIDATAVIVARALVIGALALLLGLAGVLIVVLGPALRSPILPPGSDRRADAAAGGEETPGLAAILSVALGASIGGGAGAVLLVAGTLASLGAGVGGLGSLLLDTRIGAAAIAYLAVFTVSGALAVVGAHASVRRTGWAWAASAAAAVGVITLSWSGHATSGNDRALSLGLDTLHVVATCLWFGGLVGLLCAVAALHRRPGPDHALPTVAAVVVRFSSMALIAVGVLVVTGVYRTLAELRQIGDLAHTDYGRALLVKLVVFALMLGTGAYNRFVVHPRLERAALGLSDDDRGAGRALRASVRVELILAAVLIAVVAVLVSMSPP